MIDVVLNQCLFGLADGLFDSMQLLGDVDTGSARLDHLDDFLQMAIRPLQAKSYFSVVGMLLIGVHPPFISPLGGCGQCGDMGDHQQGDIDDRNPVRAGQLPRERGKTELDAVIIVNEDVGRPHQIECNDKQLEERARPDAEKSQHGQQAGGKVAIGGDCCEVGGQIGANNARNHEDETEEAKTVQRGDGALRLGLVHGLEPGPDIGAKAKQPRDVTENQMHIEDECRGHLGSYPFCRMSGGMAAMTGRRVMP
eukprot:gene8136-10006_t